MIQNMKTRRKKLYNFMHLRVFLLVTRYSQVLF